MEKLKYKVQPMYILMNSLYIFQKYPLTETIYRVCLSNQLSKKEISIKIYGKWIPNAIIPNIKRLEKTNYIEFVKPDKVIRIKRRGKFRSTLQPFLEYAESKGVKFSKEEVKDLKWRLFEGTGTASVRKEILKSADTMEGIINFLRNSILQALIWIKYDKNKEIRWDDANKGWNVNEKEDRRSLYQGFGINLLRSSITPYIEKILQIAFGRDFVISDFIQDFNKEFNKLFPSSKIVKD